ncbi:MAG: hypothetical protein ACR2KC_02225, partial [Acidimicrobiales bacterium]
GPATPLKGPLGPATPLKWPLVPATPLKWPLGPGRWVLLATADDLAYGAGVWAGVLAGRSLAALRPQLRFG